MLGVYRPILWQRLTLLSLHRPVLSSVRLRPFSGSPSRASDERDADEDANEVDETSQTTLKRIIVSRKTIFALSTPPGKGGVAVIRVSGPSASKVSKLMVRRIGRGKRKEDLPHAGMVRCEVLDPRNGEVIDDGLAVFFKQPMSYTGLDLIELHVHSSPAVISRILSVLSTFRGLRAADRGDFTRQAFLNGRMDLTEAEGIRDLIESETEVQRQAARRATTGQTSQKYQKMREALLDAAAGVEALLEFGEAEHIDDGVWMRSRERLTKLRDDILLYLAPSRRGEVLTKGVSMVIYGPPNVGKSSLLNALAQREAAIVTHLPGTTRDVVEVVLDIEGWRVAARDTAGLRDSSDLVESIGIQRAEEAIEQADLPICVLSLPELMENNFRPPAMVVKHIKDDSIVLLNKVEGFDPDWVRDRITSDLQQHIGDARVWPISVLKGDGMAELPAQLGKLLKGTYVTPYDFLSEEEAPLITNARHRAHLEAIVGFIDAALSCGQRDVVLAAEEMRYAVMELSKIIGRSTNEDVLNVLFSTFCIGK
ncbi:tRNA modification GTPase TrmE [Calocera cornea HHB12733]|uniref:tRNA modification GTPase TrmE n=1 Tax=Calocera cornea HHB12733 TaxID=1353952 RepID=A0A165I674_9BASI|nr:tRNA modification GTPase TrmE [Calocera cornea HHB12733]